MTIEEVIELVKKIDAMTDEDFQAFKTLVLIRGMARELRQKHPGRFNSFGKLKDYDPNREP